MNSLRLLGIRTLAWATAITIGTAIPAAAQNAQQPQPSATTPVGPPVGDFRLEPQRRIVTQPRAAPAQQQEPAAQQPAERPAARPAETAPSQQARPSAPVPRAPVQPAPTARPLDRPAAQPTGETAPGATTPDIANLPPVTDPALTPAPTAPVAAPAPAGPAPAAPEGVPLWVYLLGGLALGAVGYMILLRRRAAGRRALAVAGADLPMEPAQPQPQPQAPRAPRPDPVPRPWLEVSLVPERTTADPEESIVEFELTVRNSGGSTARNVQLQAKLICGTPEQDKEIADFHRKKPGEHRTLKVPDLPAGQELVMKARVDVKREDIKAMRVDQRLLFIPLVAVNAFYEWGTSRSGQTSKSFLVGREKEEPADKMAPFRLDLGPRVYRTVGQRPYKVERRV